MKLNPLLFLATFLIFISCGKEKVLMLPETNNNDITEITDVSVAYLFYDETQKDGIELNRKNIISTTNWLINVDKRLTLKQAIPSIMLLQNKKRNAKMHKNEAAKNYYTCFNKDKTNLSFIEFTDVVYHTGTSSEYFSKTSNITSNDRLIIDFNSSKNIEIRHSNEVELKAINKADLLTNIKNLIIDNEQQIELILNFNQNLTFQDYIAYKSLLLQLNSPTASISDNEFIYN